MDQIGGRNVPSEPDHHAVDVSIQVDATSNIANKMTKSELSAMSSESMWRSREPKKLTKPLNIYHQLKRIQKWEVNEPRLGSGAEIPPALSKYTSACWGRRNLVNQVSNTRRQLNDPEAAINRPLWN